MVRSNVPPNTSEDVSDHCGNEEQPEDGLGHRRFSSNIEVVTTLVPDSINAQHSRDAHKRDIWVVVSRVDSHDHIEGKEGHQVQEQPTGCVVKPNSLKVIDQCTILEVVGPEECDENIQHREESDIVQCEYILVSCTDLGSHLATIGSIHSICWMPNMCKDKQAQGKEQ